MKHRLVLGGACDDSCVLAWRPHHARFRRAFENHTFFQRGSLMPTMRMPDVPPALGGSVGGMFHDAALGNPDGIALRCLGQDVTYRALDQRVNQLANVLIAQGWPRGARVAILSENSIEFVTVMLACAKAGLIAACLNWRQTTDEIGHCLGLTAPNLLFVSDKFASVAEAFAAPTLRVIRFGVAFETFLSDGSAEEPGLPIASEDGLLILFTSGTTGRPKAPVISHRAVIARGLLMRADWGVRRSDGFVAWSPLSHMAAADPTLASLMQGATVTLLPGFDAAGVAEALTRHPVGWLILMPGMIERLAEELERRNAPLQRIAAAGCMANLVPVDQIVRVSRLLNAPFLNSFGSTETGITPASGNWIEPGEVPQSLAKLQSTACEIRLADAEGQPVAEGQTGEIWIRSPALFSGYWADPEATAQAFLGGWYHMGDDFLRDAKGMLHFADRSKYLIKSGGENIYPAEIELVLRNMAGVSDAVVVKRADATWGEVPVAFVVAPPETRPDLTVIRATLEANLARFKLPKEVHFIADTEIERNTTGKIRRDLLERLALAAGHEEGAQ